MLELSDLYLLSALCQLRHMRCYPANNDDAEPDGAVPTMVLEQELIGQGPRRMLLLREADGFLLRDEGSSTLAVASDLPALFDAVDAGLADDTMPD